MSILDCALQAYYPLSSMDEREWTPYTDEPSQLRRGLTLFVGLLSLSVFLGLLLSKWLSSESLERLLRQELKKQAPEIGWDLSGVEVQLADGIFPIVALRIEHLSAKDLRPCGSKFLVRAEGLLFPVQVSSLWFGQIRLGRVRAEELVFFEVPPLQACQTTPEAKGLASNPSNESKAPDVVGPSITNEIKPLPPLPLEALSVRSLSLLGPEGVEKLKGERIRVEFKTSELKVLGGFQIFSASGKAVLSPFRIDALVASDLRSLVVQVFWREGVLDAKIKNPGQKDMAADFEAKKINVGELYRALLFAGVVKNELETGANWLDAKGKLVFSPSRRVDFEEVSFGGDIGYVNSQNIRLELDSPLVLHPLKAELKDLNLAEIIRALRLDSAKWVLSHPGKIDGTLVYDKKTLSVDGLLKDSVIVFQREARKAHQKIKSGQIKLKYDLQEELTLSLEKVTLEAGHWEGGIRSRIRVQEQISDFDFEFEKLTLNPSVAEVLFGAKFGEITGNTAVHLERGKIQDLKTQAQVSEISGRGFIAQGVRVLAAFRHGDGSGQFKAQDFRFLPAELGPSFQTEWTKFVGSGDESVWSAPSGPISFTEKSGDYHFGPIRFGVPRLSGRGVLDVTVAEKLSGELLLQLPSTGAAKWKLQGTLDNLLVERKD